MKKISWVWRLAASLALTTFAASLGSLATSSSIYTWYASINKPTFNPPNWLFGPVWTVLFIMMAIAFFLVWNQGAEKKKDKNKDYRKSALLFFSIQLAANVLWSFVFFFFQNPGMAFLEIMVLWLTIILVIYYFENLNRLAAWLMIPYLFWVSFAAFLNFVIWQMN